MNPKYADILRNGPYDLPRLENKTGELEYVTDREIMGMLLLAKQSGRLSGFKDV